MFFCSLNISAKSYNITTSAYADHSLRFTTSAYADVSIKITTSAYADASIRITNSPYADHSICLRPDQDQEKIIAAIYVLEFLDE